MNAIETPRLALLSALPDPHGVIGRYVMFHWFTDGTGIYFSERLHAHRGRGLTHDLDDFADPDFPGARAAAKAAGLPYFRGGTLEMGGSQLPLDEAANYQQILSVLAPQKPFGTAFKQLMRDSLLRDRLAGITLVGEDLPYVTNRVDLDPRIRDWRGVPVPRITYGPGRHEIAAQAFYMRWIVSILKAAGADVAMAIPELPSTQFPVASGSVPDTEHLMGGMRMGRRSGDQRHRRHRPLPPPRQRRGLRRQPVPLLGRSQPDADHHGDCTEECETVGLNRRKGRVLSSIR